MPAAPCRWRACWKCRPGTGRNTSPSPRGLERRPYTGKSKALAEGPACLLIADDEAPVRRAAAQILLRKGYNVMEASDGEEGGAHVHGEYGRDRAGISR